MTCFCQFSSGVASMIQTTYQASSRSGLVLWIDLREFDCTKGLASSNQAFFANYHVVLDRQIDSYSSLIRRGCKLHLTLLTWYQVLDWPNSTFSRSTGTWYWSLCEEVYERGNLSKSMFFVSGPFCFIIIHKQPGWRTDNIATASCHVVYLLIKYLVPGAWYLVPGTWSSKFSVPGTW
jgi:hypothetical protein